MTSDEQYQLVGTPSGHLWWGAVESVVTGRDCGTWNGHDKIIETDDIDECSTCHVRIHMRRWHNSPRAAELLDVTLPKCSKPWAGFAEREVSA